MRVKRLNGKLALDADGNFYKFDGVYKPILADEAYEEITSSESELESE